MSESLYTVGKVVNTHGVKGDLKIWPQTDFADIRFMKGSRLLLVDPDHVERIPIQVESARLHKNVYIVKFAGLDKMDVAERYKGWLVKVSAEQLIDLPEGEYYFHQIVGCAVITEEGAEIGKITQILTPGANDVWVTRRPDGSDVLIPVIDEVVLHVDIRSKTVTIRLMEGL